jgi:hypothetical protein
VPVFLNRLAAARFVLILGMYVSPSMRFVFVMQNIDGVSNYIPAHATF